MDEPYGCITTRLDVGPDERYTVGCKLDIFFEA